MSSTKPFEAYDQERMKRAIDDINRERAWPRRLVWRDGHSLPRIHDFDLDDEWTTTGQRAGDLLTSAGFDLIEVVEAHIGLDYDTDRVLDKIIGGGDYYSRRITIDQHRITNVRMRGPTEIMAKRFHYELFMAAEMTKDIRGVLRVMRSKLAVLETIWRLGGLHAIIAYPSEPCDGSSLRAWG